MTSPRRSRVGGAFAIALLALIALLSLGSPASAGGITTAAVGRPSAVPHSVCASAAARTDDRPTRSASCTTSAVVRPTSVRSVLPRKVIAGTRNDHLWSMTGAPANVVELVGSLAVVGSAGTANASRAPPSP